MSVTTVCPTGGRVVFPLRGAFWEYPSEQPLQFIGVVAWRNDTRSSIAGNPLAISRSMPRFTWFNRRCHENEPSAHLLMWIGMSGK